MTIAELIERLEKATGPDRELDFALFPIAVPVIADLWQHWTAEQQENIVLAYTASIDAAVAFLDHVLPGWFWRAGSTPLFPNGWAYVSKYHADHCDRKDEAASADGKAATPAIALCIAILKAKQAQEVKS